MGFIFKAAPRNAAAAPIRPPRRICSRDSKARRNVTLSIISSVLATISSADAPSFAFFAASSTIKPWAPAAVRVSTTWIGMGGSIDWTTRAVSTATLRSLEIRTATAASTWSAILSMMVRKSSGTTPEVVGSSSSVSSLL